MKCKFYMNKKISIKEIAEICNVSVATISRVINHKGGYSKETKEKVLKLIAESEYRQNMNAKSLRTNKSQTIGIIVPDISNEFFAKIIQSVEKEALKYDYSVFVCNTDENIEIEKMQLNKLIGQFVDGIIYISGGLNLHDYINVDIPMVFIDRYVEDSSIFIESDNFNGGYMATKELIDSGCKKIIIMKSSKEISAYKSRYLGYLKALEDKNLNFSDELACNIDIIDYKVAHDKILEVLDSGITFDGVFATNDAMAIGIVMALNERRIKIPEEVKIVGFDNISATEITSIPITTINQNKKKMGEIAVELLMDRILNRESVITNRKLPVNLIRRKSTENKS